MDDRFSDAASVAENGWRQGSVLPPALVSLLIKERQIPATIIPQADFVSNWLGALLNPFKRASIWRRNASLLDPANDRWLVISQDCDLVQNDWNKEPYVELLRIRPADDNEHLPQWLTNPRDLQFSDPPDTKSQRFITSIHDRVLIDRRYLVDENPDRARTFHRENVRRVCLWVSRRYVRAAFPDEFNFRTKDVLGSLKKKNSSLYKQSHLLTGIYTLVTEDELGPEDEYDVSIWGTMRIRDFSDPEIRRVAQEIIDDLMQALDGCPGIDVVDCQLKSEQDVSLDHLHMWKRWDFDELSLRPKNKAAQVPPVQDLPPDL